jgi:hypothetical protein
MQKNKNNKRCTYVFLTSGPTNITKNKIEKTTQKINQQNVNKNLGPQRLLGTPIARGQKDPAQNFLKHCSSKNQIYLFSF